jgi:hypothetical protein
MAIPDFVELVQGSVDVWFRRRYTHRVDRFVGPPRAPLLPDKSFLGRPLNLERFHDRGGLHGAERQRSGQTQKVMQIDPAPSNGIEVTVVD